MKPVKRLANNNYKITSDLEGKLLEEMKDYDVELYSKKRALINCLKEYKIFTPVATYTDGADTFKLSVISDQDDELCPVGSKQLKLVVYSLFNISDHRQNFIEQVKMETQANKNLITLIPDSTEFLQIDKLLGEISRYTYIEQKYSNETDQSKRQIIRDFSIIREEKEKHLRLHVENAYKNAALIYMFDQYLLNADTFKGTINDVQKKQIKNIYTKRLTNQLSETLVPKVFSARKEDLTRLFTGNEFKFFDTHGNFTGEHLKVIEEINAKISTRAVDGRSLEADLSGDPWGYSFGTIVTTLAALLRAGRLTVRHNAESFFSHDSKAVHEAFTNATKFKAASFKSITATLSSADKTKAVQLLMDLEVDSYIGRKVDWNMTDFDLADAIKSLADSFITALQSLNETVDQFEAQFSTVAAQKTVLLNYSSKVTESNYLEKVGYLLANEDDFKAAIQLIIKAQKFIKKNFVTVKDHKRFIESVIAELIKAERTDQHIDDAYAGFMRLYQQDMIKNFAQLQQQAQEVRDSYFKFMKNAASGMSHKYQVLENKVDAVIHQLKLYPTDLNSLNQKKLNELKQYCSARTLNEPNPEFSITCTKCGYSLSDILNYTELAPNKEHELLIVQSSFISEASEPEPEIKTETETETETTILPPVVPRKIKLQVQNKFMTVQDYKTLLTSQLSALASARPEEKIELTVEWSE